MKKLIKDYLKKGRTIVTTNGVTTKTAAVYVGSIKDYTPLENGFNRALADEIVGIVESSQGRLWNQGHWREFFGQWDAPVDRDVLEALNPALVDPKDANERCGTTMCIAGWAGELTGADWVVDLTLGKAGWTSFDDWVLIRREDLATDGSMREDFGPFNNSNYAEPLKKRGFSRETHAAVLVSDYARHALGIGTDPLMLFDGDNSWARVLGCIDAYTEYGPHFLPGEKLEVYTLAHGSYQAQETYGYDADEIVAYLESIKGRGIGFDYHEENVPQWASDMADA